MTTLKKKIKIIPSLPENKENKKSNSQMLITIIIFILLLSGGYLVYINLLPYINAININNITGKKIFINDCNTKDYIIISSDKSYSIQLTNENCEAKHYEGSLKIKNNEIIFNNDIKGIIDSEYNIIINDNKFESEDANE